MALLADLLVIYIHGFDTMLPFFVNRIESQAHSLTGVLVVIIVSFLDFSYIHFYNI